MKKRSLFFGLILLIAIASLLPVSVYAEENETNYCTCCQQEIPVSDYISIGGEQTETLALESGKHYRLTADITGAPESGVLVRGAGCMDLNGFNITAGDSCIAISCNGGTTGIMGTGVITGTYDAASYGATIHTDGSAVVHLYGGTYKKAGNNAAIYIGASCKVHLYDDATIDTAGTYATYPTAVFMEKSSGLFHMHGGMVIGGTTTSNGGTIRVSNGTMTMDGGTVTGGQAERGGNIAVNSSGKLTINGGTISSGTATATYGGGNIYTNKRTVTINGGLITLGVAAGSSYGGGNIGVYRATLNITGGIISKGSANIEGCTGGGNLYVNGDIAKLNISGGTITDGTTAGNGGNIYLCDGKLTISDGKILSGTSGGRGGNIGIKSATVTVSGGTMSDGTATTNGGNISLYNSTTNITGGNISTGSAAGSGGNIFAELGNLQISGSNISDGSADDLGGGNIYILDAAMTMTDGTISGGFTSANGGSILLGGSFAFSGGTITGGQAERGGNIAVRDGGELTVNGGTITSGTATATYGGGNIYTNKCPVNISNGLITAGIAGGSSYGGGNLGIYKATVIMTGGSITNGSAANSSCRGGGNVYMDGDNAVFEMTGGLLTGGYIATGKGHSIYARSGAVYLGADAKITNKAEGTGGSMNLYLHDGILESAAYFTGGVYVTDGQVAITGGTYYSFYYHGDDLCTITGGVFRVDYSQYIPDDYLWIRRATSGDYIYTVVHKDLLPCATLVSPGALNTTPTNLLYGLTPPTIRISNSMVI